MIAVIEKHKEYEYKAIGYDERPEICLFGSDASFSSEYEPGLSEEELRKNRNDFEKVPFYRELADSVLRAESSCRKLVYLRYMVRLLYASEHFFIEENSKAYEFQLRFTADLVQFEGYKKYTPYCGRLGKILDYLILQSDQKMVFRTLLQLQFSLIELVGTDFLKQPCSDETDPTPHGSAMAETLQVFSYVFDMLEAAKKEDEEFSLYFKKTVLYEELVPRMHLKTNEYLRAIRMELTDENLLFHTLLSDKSGSGSEIASFSRIYEKDCLNEEEAALKKKLFREFSTRVIFYESLRGQKDTALSQIARNFQYLSGAENFCRLLRALGSEKFNRYTEYLYGDLTKSELLSTLMRRCQPEHDNTSEKMKELLSDAGLSEKRLVEAAMYAPQWAGLIGKLVSYQDLRKAVWFFHAHISEQFEEWKKHEIAVYSPVRPEQFNNGVFDIAWYREIENELDRNQLKLLYDSAKYITQGSNAHRRSQLFVDAMNGRLDLQQTEDTIREKRNQDLLRAYAVIPLKESSHDLMRRYDFICQFGKESSAFGALKRASENTAVLSALENLALNCGFSDVNRMMWYLEGKKSEALQPFYDGILIDHCVISIAVDETGDSSLRILKNGRLQKTLPKELEKDERILSVKAAVKELKNQKSRNRMSLENAMINQSAFTQEELLTIYQAPVLRALLSQLIWVDQNENFGLIEQNDQKLLLVDYRGSRKAVEKNTVLKIAHPYHLSKSGVWAEYMHLIYHRQIRQPFKQIFREYYPLSPQELEESSCSRRYAGIQVRKGRMLALLKKRGWVVNYEEGFSKVFYHQAVISHLYSYADWFTPGDIEEPSLEEICFEDRSSGKMLVLPEIDPIVFSETMRDLDLVVSCAYVGGIDLQTSQSAVSLRISIAKELLRLLKLENVSFTEHFALVKGKLAEYRIHMGSGTVHVDAKGVLPVFPVYSQQRGHIFLPFVDEDPKTAQILSEIITFAQDNRLKDPTLLQWLE